jgi:hypothetical protein
VKLFANLLISTMTPILRRRRMAFYSVRNTIRGGVYTPGPNWPTSAFAAVDYGDNPGAVAWRRLDHELAADG